MPAALDRYEITTPVRERGPGSFVFRATDARTGDAVVVKRLPAGSDAASERAALRVARLPGVVELLDEGSWEGAPVLVMRWVDGEPFPGSACSSADLRQRLGQLLIAVGGLHRLGLVHRDLKPDNVLVGPDGRVTVLDLGLCVVGGSGRASGTLAYEAPEQLLGEPSAASDLYSVGVMGLEAVLGRLPYDGDLVAAKLLGRLVACPADAPRDVAAVLTALTRTSPTERPGALEALVGLHLSRERLHLRAPAMMFETRAEVRRLLGPLRGRERAATLATWRMAGVLDGDRVRARALTRHTVSTRVGGDLDAAVAEASRLAGEGEAEIAESLLASVAPGVRRDERWLGVVADWARLVVQLGRVDAADRWLGEVHRREGADPSLIRAVEGARHLAAGDGRRALESATGVPHFLAHVVACLAARWLDPDAHAAAVRAFREFAESADDPEAAASAEVAQAHLAYRVGRSEDAASAHERAAERFPAAAGRVKAWLNAAAAWLEVPDLRRASRALDAAERSSLGFGLDSRVRARVLRRAIGYRSGRSRRPDVAWIDTLRLAEDPNLPVAALTEAAVAWRAGLGSLALGLAREAADGFVRVGREPPAVLAIALGVAAGGPSPPELPARIAHIERSAPLVAAQARRLVSRPPAVRGRGYREVLSPEEWSKHGV